MNCSAKFRQKPLVVAAEQFVYQRTPWPRGVELHKSLFYPCIYTAEGAVEVKDLDWIITGTDGGKFPCRPNIFNRLYEPIEDK